MQEVSASLPATQIGGTSKDEVENVVDAFRARAIGFAVNIHKETDGSFVLMVCSSVPGPGCELRVSFECDGALTYCDAGGNEPIRS